MSKKGFWLVILLSVFALVGTLGLQVYWIRATLSIVEAEFDKSVAESLDHVSKRLERDEEAQSLHEIESASPNEESKQVRDYDEEIEYLERRKVQRMLDAPPVEERIVPMHLDAYIKEELSSRGIKTTYNYGVFSNKHSAFVIKDNSFVVLDPAHPQNAQLGYKQMYESKYFVHLFRDDIESPGVLMVYFPEVAGIRWKRTWPALLPTLLFLLMLSTCFAYTLWFVFRQKKLSEMKNDFINNMTHEFKTPIATISLAADTIESPKVLNDPDRIKRYVKMIRQENMRMNNQVEKVLQMALVEKEDLKIKFELLNLHDIIETAVSNFAIVVEQKEGSLSSDLQAKECFVSGDVTHISNVVNNLLDNANKYTPESPQIVIATRDTALGIQLSVTDNGLGISKENQRYVFDKFFRVHTGNVHDVKGFGMGLSYVKAIIAAHKGRVEVESTLGVGSKFSVFLPTAKAETDAAM